MQEPKPPPEPKSSPMWYLTLRELVAVNCVALLACRVYDHGTYLPVEYALWITQLLSLLYLVSEERDGNFNWRRAVSAFSLLLIFCHCTWVFALGKVKDSQEAVVAIRASLGWARGIITTPYDYLVDAKKAEIATQESGQVFTECWNRNVGSCISGLLTLPWRVYTAEYAVWKDMAKLAPTIVCNAAWLAIGMPDSMQRRILYLVLMLSVAYVINGYVEDQLEPYNRSSAQIGSLFVTFMVVVYGRMVAPSSWPWEVVGVVAAMAARLSGLFPLAEPHMVGPTLIFVAGLCPEFDPNELWILPRGILYRICMWYMKYAKELAAEEQRKTGELPVVAGGLAANNQRKTEESSVVAGELAANNQPKTGKHSVDAEKRVARPAITLDEGNPHEQPQPQPQHQIHTPPPPRGGGAWDHTDMGYEEVEKRRRAQRQVSRDVREGEERDTSNRKRPTP